MDYDRSAFSKELCMKYGHGTRRADLILQKAGKIIKDLKIPVRSAVLCEKNARIGDAAFHHVGSCYDKAQTSTPKCERKCKRPACFLSPIKTVPVARQKVDVIAVQPCVAITEEQSLVLSYAVSQDNSLNIAVKGHGGPAGIQVEPACHVQHKSLELHSVAEPLVFVNKPTAARCLHFSSIAASCQTPDDLDVGLTNSFESILWSPVQQTASSLSKTAACDNIQCVLSPTQSSELAVLSTSVTRCMVISPVRQPVAVKSASKASSPVCSGDVSPALTSRVAVPFRLRACTAGALVNPLKEDPALTISVEQPACSSVRAADVVGHAPAKLGSGSEVLTPIHAQRALANPAEDIAAFKSTPITLLQPASSLVCAANCNIPSVSPELSSHTEVLSTPEAVCKLVSPPGEIASFQSTSITVVKPASSPFRATGNNIEGYSVGFGSAVLSATEAQNIVVSPALEVVPCKLAFFTNSQPASNSVASADGNVEGLSEELACCSAVLSSVDVDNMFVSSLEQTAVSPVLSAANSNEQAVDSEVLRVSCIPAINSSSISFFEGSNYMDRPDVFVPDDLQLESSLQIPLQSVEIVYYDDQSFGANAFHSEFKVEPISQINSIVTNDGEAFLGISCNQFCGEFASSYELHPLQTVPLPTNTEGIHINGICSWVTDTQSYMPDSTLTIDAGVMVNSVDQAFQDLVEVSADVQNVSSGITKSTSTAESACQDNGGQSGEAVAINHTDCGLTLDMTDNREITTSMVQTIEEVSQDDGIDPDASENVTVSGYIQSPVRARRKKVWKKQLRKQNRVRGLAYVGSRGQAQAARTLRPNPCLGKKCQNKCGTKWSEEHREATFRQYWEMTHQQQRDWLLSHIDQKAVRDRVTKRTAYAERQASFMCWLLLNGAKTRVCKQFFMKTLDIKPRLISYTLRHATAANVAKQDARGAHRPKNKTPDEDLAGVRQFISSLPAVPSHYCRSSTDRRYLPVECGNMSRLYAAYQTAQKEKCLSCVSTAVFKKVFLTEFNIGFHTPKKDKCLLCEKFKNTPEDSRSEELKQKVTEHEAEKIATYEEFKRDQEARNCDAATICASFDLQKVLNTPYGSSVLLFYSRKYAVYNFSVYESVTRKGHCFVWGEADGRRGAAEMASCLFQWLQAIDIENAASHIILYCDCCSGQNRNRTVVSMLRYALTVLVNVKQITLKFLLTGHSYMPADSIHSTVERFTRKRTVWAPSEWETVIRMARHNPGPYEVIKMSYESFKNWSSVSTTIPIKWRDESGKSVLWKKMRAIDIKKDADFCEIRYTFQEDGPVHIASFAPAKSRSYRSASSAVSCPSILYRSRLPIPSQKYIDLKRLCETGVIPESYHAEYLSLPTADNIPDTLAQTDEEDCVDG